MGGVHPAGVHRKSSVSRSLTALMFRPFATSSATTFALLSLLTMLSPLEGHGMPRVAQPGHDRYRGAEIKPVAPAGPGVRVHADRSRKARSQCTNRRAPNRRSAIPQAPEPPPVLTVPISRRSSPARDRRAELLVETFAPWTPRSRRGRRLSWWRRTGWPRRARVSTGRRRRGRARSRPPARHPTSGRVCA